MIGGFEYSKKSKRNRLAWSSFTSGDMGDWETTPTLAVHDQVLLLVSYEHADRAAEWLTEIMEGIGESAKTE